MKKRREKGIICNIHNPTGDDIKRYYRANRNTWEIRCRICIRIFDRKRRKGKYKKRIKELDAISALLLLQKSKEVCFLREAKELQVKLTKMLYVHRSIINEYKQYQRSETSLGETT